MLYVTAVYLSFWNSMGNFETVLTLNGFILIIPNLFSILLL